MRPILIEIVDRLADMATRLDAMEAELVANGVLQRGAISSRFHNHKQIVEGHLGLVRAMVDRLP